MTAQRALRAKGAASLSLFFIDGVAGGKDTTRGCAVSSASEGDGIAVPILYYLFLY